MAELQRKHEENQHHFKLELGIDIISCVPGSVYFGVVSSIIVTLFSSGKFGCSFLPDTYLFTCYTVANVHLSSGNFDDS